MFERLVCIERASSDEEHNVAYKSIDCTGAERRLGDGIPLQIVAFYSFILIYFKVLLINK
jgi:hypothetical protein